MTDIAMAASPRWETVGTVAVLDLGPGENRLNPDSIGAIDACLDEIEDSDVRGLVTTGGGKIWSNGMDTDWIAHHPDRGAETLEVAEHLLARLLAFPVPTVAAIQGHAFAGGLLLALAHDLRVMRSDRGFLSLPEVNFDAVFSEGMTDLLRARLAPQVAHRAMLMAQRYDALAAQEAGLVDECVPLDKLTARACALAEEAGGRSRATVSALKAGIYAQPLRSLGNPPPPALVAALVNLGRS
ncbi:MAG TPA: enoyl-CoA hydratase/isomerase family protein [Sporichthyaceae bacterium]|jgi:enoyl-CoA hydratase/carnithine racemase|nr:enoyl-CoA hydratase/isomerase family protein [Sporichthyaceae bacterium]